MLIFTLAYGGKVIARPGGTEPKIKFYVLLTRISQMQLSGMA